ncbi:MAG: GC-type dockerin domain-anchored protein [Phycisphaerae bacterium]
MMKRVSRLAMIATTVAAVASTAVAGGTITAGNASLQFVGIPVFSSTLGDGTFKTETTGTDQLYKFTWYYRTATATTNRVMSALDTPTESYVGNVATFTYLNAGPGVAGQERFDATITTTLTDGAIVNQSRVVSLCRVKSRATTARRYDFFVLVDLDLAGGTPTTPVDDTFLLDPATFNMRQTEASTTNIANVRATAPSRWQVASGTTLRTLLSGPTADLNQAVGPFTGDGAVAFQWTVTLQPNEETTLAAAFAINQSAFCQGPVVTGQPQNATACPGGSATFTTTGTDIASHQWRVGTSPGTWVALTGPSPFVHLGTGLSFDFAGATGPSLTVSNFQVGSQGPAVRFSDRVTGDCGSVDGNAATLTVESCVPPCPADFNQDGGIDGGDVGAFFIAWEAAAASADVNQDGGVDGSDLSTFFAAWEAGGC